VEEVTGEPLYRDRVCGIGIGKAQMVAAIRVPSEKDPARRAAETRSFGTTRREVLALADWLRCWQVPAVVMEAAGDYWKGPLYRLEAEGFECVLADAKQVKNLPGRPERDPADSRWLAACFERGAVRSCLAATPEFRIIWLHTRYRRDLTGERAREKNRAEKLLESAAIKISSVLTGLHGVTGRDIMDRLIAGERNPEVLARLARTAARRKISQLEQAVEGAEFFTPAHAALLAKVLARIDRLSRRHRGPVRGDPGSAGPVRGTAGPGRVDARLGTPRRPGHPGRDRPGHDQVPCRRAPVLLGPAAPRTTTSPARAKDAPRPTKATGTWAPSPARPPWRPAAPRPAKAPGTGGWPEDAAPPKPAPPPGTPS
jgi:transposase